MAILINVVETRFGEAKCLLFTFDMTSAMIFHGSVNTLSYHLLRLLVSRSKKNNITTFDVIRMFLRQSKIKSIILYGPKGLKA